MLERDGLDALTFGERRKLWLGGLILATAQLEHRPKAPKAGKDRLASLGVSANLAVSADGAAVDVAGFFDELVEGLVKLAQHGIARKLAGSDVIEIGLDAGGEAIVDDGVEMVRQEASDQLSCWGGQ